MSQRPAIKICGIRSRSSLEAAAAAGADFVGIVFAPGSPRRVTPAEGRALATALPSGVKAVALVQLESIRDLDAIDWPHEWVQLHGQEDEALVETVARRHRVLRGFRFTEDAVRRWDGCAGVEVLLPDGSSGGEGRAFAHDALVRLMPDVDKPVMLAGGLDPSNVADAIQAVRPWGVDVSSGVESSPGVKDDSKIRAFCTAASGAATGRS